MDLSKAYDYLPLDLLAAKFEAYGIDRTGLNLIQIYLSNRKQRAKINSSYSDWYINDLLVFIERTNIWNFADGNTIYSSQNDLKTILEDLRYDMKTLLR